MEGLFYYGSMVAIIIFVINMISALKNIRDNKDTEYNEAAIIFSLIFILVSIFRICGN
ncbi:hypothetical protein ACTNDY_00670 [Tissierellaceae bacterium HCP3S3_D8]